MNILGVKDIGAAEEKSLAEFEEELINEVIKPKSDEEPEDEEVVAPVINIKDEKPESVELKDEDVLSFIKTKYNKDINSIEDILKENSPNENLPEDVAAFLQYNKSTGRGLSDYLKLGQDFNAMSESELLFNWKKSTEEGLDDSDIREMIDEEYSVDEDIDSDSEIKRKSRIKKKDIAKAKSYFEEQKKMYKEPLESRIVQDIPSDVKEKVEAYDKYINESKNYDESVAKRRDKFISETNKLFSDFKGFDFKIDNNKVVNYAPINPEELKASQLDTSNFMKKFVDENGMLKDAKGFHRALAIASDPDKYAKFFYEQGIAEATEGVTKKIKNINMSERKVPETTKKEGVQVRSINQDSGSGLRIKSRKS